MDEANLIPDGSSHDALKAKFVNDTIVVNGERHDLHRNKWIVFTGNADNLPGRIRSPMAAESFITQYFKPMKPEQLQSYFVRPLLRGRNHALLERHAVDIHTALHQVYPESHLSPRNLEEYVAQVVCLSETSRPEHAGPDALAPWMVRLALTVYGASLPASDAPVIESWLRRKLNVPPDAILPALPQANLAGTSLLATASTQALANSVHWWLQTQRLRRGLNPEKNVIGQRALLIEGPASRGKDAVVIAVLDAARLKYARVNADPGNLKPLQEALEDGCKKGKVVLVDELNNLPSGILEGELNAVLAGDRAVHANFALIATVNPGEYAGRKPLSPALENRMFKIVIDDYAPQELRSIAHHVADNLFTRQKGMSRTRLPAIPRESIDALVDLHQTLANRLADSPEEFKPTLRELSRALEEMFRQPRMALQTAFDNAYAYYRFQAARTDTAVRSMQSAIAPEHQHQLARQMRRAVMLAHPEWLAWPETIADEALPFNRPVQYDGDDHRLRFNPHLEIGQLCDAVLQHALHDLRSQPRSLQTPATRTTPLVSNFDPSNDFISAVGNAPQEEDIGRISNVTEDYLYLETGRRTLRNETVKFPRLRIKDDATAFPATAARITLDNVYVNRARSEAGRVYLPATSDTRPAQVSLDGIASRSVCRDGDGGWYVDTDVSGAFIEKVTYSLAGFPEAKRDHESRPPDLPFFSDLDISPDGNQAMRAILALAGQYSSRPGSPAPSRQDIADALANLFLDPANFQYSQDDAHALNSSNGVAARCQRFLEHGKGVCFEYAYTYAAVLEQLFHIRTRLCNGYLTIGERIPALGHLWVEFENENGQWRRIDPTPPVQESGRMLESTASLARSVAASSVSTIFQTDYFYNIPDDQLNISRDLLRQIDLGQLDLLYWSTERALKTYNAVAGTFDVKRFMQGKPDFYLDAKPITSMKQRAIYIENLPAKEDAGAWVRFLARMVRPIQALIDRGIAIYYYESDGAQVRLENAQFIQHACEPSPSSFRPRHDDEGILRIDAGSNTYFERIAAVYYEAVLNIGEVDRSNDEAAVDCIISELRFFIERLGKRGGLPIQIPLHGKTLTITREAVDASTLGENDRKFVRSVTNAMEEAIRAGRSNPDMGNQRLEAATRVILNRLDSRPTVSAKLHAMGRILAMIAESDLGSAPGGIAALSLGKALLIASAIRDGEADAASFSPASAGQWVALLLMGHVANSGKGMIDEAIQILSRLPTMPANTAIVTKLIHALQQIHESKAIAPGQKENLRRQCQRLCGMN